MSAGTGTQPPVDQNLALAKAMGSKRGYDPMPPAQHEWQQTEGQPPLYRLWSWLCAHTIRARYVGNRQVRTAYATGEDGETAVTLVHAAKNLGLDLGHLSNVWKEGAEAGIWRRDGKSRRLYLSGDFTAEQVLAIKAGQVERTLNLNRAELLKLKELPKETQQRFHRVWEHAQELRAKIAAAKMAEAREACDGIEDNIRAEFGLPNKRLAKRRDAEPVAVPQLLLEFLPPGLSEQLSVHSTAPRVIVHSPEVVSTLGENRGENVSRTTPLSLLDRETLQRRTTESVGRSVEERTDGHTEAPAAAQIAELKTLLIEEYGNRFPGETPKPQLCRATFDALRGAPLELLRETIRQRMKSATSMGFAVPLARDVGIRWAEGAAARAKAEGAAQTATLEATENIRANALATIADPNAFPSDLQFAKENLRWADKTLAAHRKAKSTGGAS